MDFVFFIFWAAGSCPIRGFKILFNCYFFATYSKLLVSIVILNYLIIDGRTFLFVSMWGRPETRAAGAAPLMGRAGLRSAVIISGRRGKKNSRLSHR